MPNLSLDQLAAAITADQTIYFDDLIDLGALGATILGTSSGPHLAQLARLDATTPPVSATPPDTTAEAWWT